MAMCMCLEKNIVQLCVLGLLMPVCVCERERVCLPVLLDKSYEELFACNMSSMCVYSTKCIACML